MISKGLPIHKLPPLFRSMQEEKTKYGDKLFMNETAKGKLFSNQKFRSIHVYVYVCCWNAWQESKIKIKIKSASTYVLYMQTGGIQFGKEIFKGGLF